MVLTGGTVDLEYEINLIKTIQFYIHTIALDMAPDVLGKIYIYIN